MSFTSAEYAAHWARRVQQIDPSVKAAIKQMGRLTLATAQGLLTAEIYSIPEDRSPTGRPLWRRTNQLAHKERLEYSSDGAGFRLVNETPYAEPRHEAGKPGRRFTRRPAHWRDDTFEVMKFAGAAVLQDALQHMIAGTPAGISLLRGQAAVTAKAATIAAKAQAKTVAATKAAAAQATTGAKAQAKGATAPQGHTGSSGHSGKTGHSGKIGRSGSTGRTGSTGSSGGGGGGGGGVIRSKKVRAARRRSLRFLSTGRR